MSNTAAPANVAANLRWFGVVYTLVLVAVAGVVAVAAQYEFELPVTGAAIGAFAGVVAAAGHRFAQQRGFKWVSKDRHLLALGYVAVAVVISCALFGALASYDPGAGAQLIDAWRGAPQMVIGAALFSLVIHYGMARLMLRFVANRGEKHER